MKRIIITLAILAMAGVAQASPYLVSDASTDATVDSCQIDGIALPCVLDATKAINIDLQPLAAGSYNVKARFCTGGGVWCSPDSVPFAFSKPGALTRPTILRLGK